MKTILYIYHTSVIGGGSYCLLNILKTADKEIELLEKKLELIKQEKKAMMQLLLTGIVRVDGN